MKLFISYACAEDQLLALRIQTLLACSGMTAYVPPATTRVVSRAVIAERDLQILHEADAVVCVMNGPLSPITLSELHYAAALGKIAFTIAAAGTADQASKHLILEPVFEVLPDDPVPMLAELHKFLGEQIELRARDLRRSLSATAILATALIGLFPFEEKEIRRQKNSVDAPGR